MLEMAGDGVSPREFGVLLRAGGSAGAEGSAGAGLCHSIFSLSVCCVPWPRGWVGFPRCLCMLWRHRLQISSLLLCLLDSSGLLSPGSPRQFRMEIAASSWGLESTKIMRGTAEVGLCPHLPAVPQSHPSGWLSLGSACILQCSLFSFGRDKATFNAREPGFEGAAAAQ